MDSTEKKKKAPKGLSRETIDSIYQEAAKRFKNHRKRVLSSQNKTVTYKDGIDYWLVEAAFEKGQGIDRKNPIPRHRDSPEPGLVVGEV